MLSTILSKIKLYTIPVLMVLLGIVYALFRSEQAGRAKDRLAVIHEINKTQEKATKALVEGLQHEQDVAKEPVDTHRRDYFSK